MVRTYVLAASPIFFIPLQYHFLYLLHTFYMYPIKILVELLIL
nr:MAG TPA: hypothetical protein [Bacteriophage sp.]